MGQYSVLLVDDEEFVFEVMMKKLNWEEMGFHIDGYARNGLEALEMAEENLPDVVMTDIKMPYMDGLTLCRRLKEQYPNIKVIIFSGFDDFEFAKEAIKLEAEEYILKPIDAEELREVFERVKKALDKEIDERRNIDKLQEYYLNSLPMLQDNFYVSLIEGRISGPLVSKYASDYQLDIHGPNYVACVLHVSYKEKNGAEMEVAPFMLSLSVQQMVEEQLQGKWCYRALSYLGDVVILVQLEDMQAVNHFTDHMDRICKMAKRVCNATVTAGIGYMVDKPENLKISYKGAVNALSHRVLLGHMRAINIQEVELQQAEKALHKDKHDAHAIVKVLRLNDKDSLFEAIHHFCNSLYVEGRTIREYRTQLLKLSVELMEFTEQYELDMEKMIGSNKDIVDELLVIESQEELVHYINALCDHILQEVDEKRTDNRTSFVIQAVDYVKENYGMKELDIDTICQFLNVSSSYFSTAFKKDTGKTFIAYLTDYRMEQAVKLLETTEYKTYEIAEMVGYADPNYFSYAFKKKFGVSPSKYTRRE